MKVIEDLMEAYSEYVGLPLFLVNVDGEINYMAGESHYCVLDNSSASFLSELRNVAFQLNTSTIISLADCSSPQGCFYFITPVFKLKQSQHFLVAGPFLVESNMDCALQKPLKIFNDKELEEQLSKIKNLHHLFVNRENVETKFLFPEKLVYILQNMKELEGNRFDEQNIYRILDEFLQIKAFDFLGIATKNENHVFVVQHINGENVRHLTGKRFYMGEGLLGKAVILGKDFYWNKGISVENPEFLNRYGIFPKQLFGYIIQQDNTVKGIIFGGSFRDEIISENLLKSMRFIIDLIFQKKMIQSKIHHYQYVQMVFNHFLDFLDLAMNVRDSKVIANEILKLCHTLNNGKFACFTLNDEFSFIGKMDNEGVERHQKAKANNRASLWVDEQYIHFSMENRGFYTVLKDEENEQQIIYLLNLIITLLRDKDNVSFNQGKKDESIFHLLQEGMQEMNQRQYHLSTISIKFAKNIMDILKVENDCQENVVNICKILPYRMEFLENYINNTKEWGIMTKLYPYINENKNAKDESLEIKLLLFIYKVIFQKEDEERFDFLSAELNEIFMKVYKAMFESTKDSLEEKKEISREQLDELTDLKTLTPREKEILYLILEGLNNQEVGDYLNISVHTVKNHVTNIFKKLNVSDRIQAMVKVYRIRFGEELHLDI